MRAYVCAFLNTDIIAPKLVRFGNLRICKGPSGPLLVVGSPQALFQMLDYLTGLLCLGGAGARVNVKL